jgi:hypothetical protein
MVERDRPVNLALEFIIMSGFRDFGPTYYPNVADPVVAAPVNTVSGIAPDGAGDVQLTINGNLPSGVGDWPVTVNGVDHDAAGNLALTSGSSDLAVTIGANEIKYTIEESPQTENTFGAGAALANDIWTAIVGGSITLGPTDGGIYLIMCSVKYSYTKAACSRAKLSLRGSRGGTVIAIQEWAEDALLTDAVANDIWITLTAQVDLPNNGSFQMWEKRLNAGTDFVVNHTEGKFSFIRIRKTA